MTKDFTNGSITPAIAKFALPMLLGNIFQQLYNTVDSIVVGRFVGMQALAAVGSTFGTMFLLFSLLMGFTNGISIVLAQLYGAKDFAKLKRAYSTAVFFILALSALLCVVGIVIAKPMLLLLKTPPEILADATLYLRIMFGGVFAGAIYNGYSAILRAMGDSRTPLYFLIVATITNIVLDLVFVIVFGWGVMGVAVATVIAQLLSGILCVINTYHRLEYFRLKKGEWVFDVDLFKAIVRYGFPTAIQQSMVSIGILCVQGVVNSFGTTMVATYNATNKVETFATMPLMNFGMALSVFTGQNIGAGKYDRATKGLRATIGMQVVIALVLGALLYAFGPSVIKLFVQDTETEIIRIGTQAIRLICWFFILFGVMQSFNAFLRGAGDASYAMFSSFVMILVRVPAVYILSKIPSITYMAVWYSMLCGWTASFLFNFVRFLTGRWRNKSVTGKKAADALALEEAAEVVAEL